MLTVDLDLLMEVDVFALLEIVIITSLTGGNGQSATYQDMLRLSSQIVDEIRI